MGKLSHTDVVHLLIQLSIMLLMGRMLAEVARKFKQPAVIGEIIAGLLLGPTVLGMINPDWFQTLYPVPSANATILSGFVQVAVVMLLFVAGLEVDLHIVRQQGKQAIFTSLLGLIIPFAVGFIFPYYFPEFFGIAGHTQKLIFSVILSMIGKEGDISIGYTVLLAVSFVAIMLTLGRGIFNRVLPWVNKK